MNVPGRNSRSVDDDLQMFIVPKTALKTTSMMLKRTLISSPLIEQAQGRGCLELELLLPPKDGAQTCLSERV